MATFNGATFLQVQLNSLAAQTYLLDVLWITDDGSTDATQTIVNTFAGIAPFKVNFVENPKRLGCGRNFLKAASLAGGEYVAFCYQDNFWLPNKLEWVARIAKEFAPGLIVHSGRVVDEDLNGLGHRFPDIKETIVIESSFKSDFTFFPGYTLVVNRRLIQLLGVDEVVRNDLLCPSIFAHDQWLCNAAQDTTTCVHLSDKLVLYRQHDCNLIGFKKNPQDDLGVFV
ncbi:glycosyltransferase [bacterium]|jgi:glycosyltransferase involved in cell wall biosynthesis|nr:glycosyltransferase [bacterium]